MPTVAEPIPTLDRHRPMARRVIALALPVLLQQIIIVTVSLSDRWLAGTIPVETEDAHAALQAAQTTANYLAWFVSSYTVLVSAGASAVVARCIGAGERNAAIRATHQALLLALVIGGIGSAFGLCFTEQLIHALNLKGEAAALAVSYLQPMFWLLPFQAVEAAGVACLQGAGDTRTGMFIQGGIALCNLPVAFIMCRGIGSWEGLKFRGISWGTATCFTLGAIVVVTVLRRGRAGLALRRREFRPDPQMLWRLLRISIPAGLDSLSIVAGQIVFLHIVNNLGNVAAAAHGTALGWESLSFQTAHPFGIAAMALVGQNLGAKRPREAARAGWTAFGLGCFVSCSMGVLFYTFAPYMARFLNPYPEQANIVEEAVRVLRLVALATPGLVSTIVFTQALRGAGDTKVPVLFTWFGFLAVRLPLAYFLTSATIGWGLYGAWLAMCADLVVRGTFFFARFASGRWKTARA
jgi:putative MATE family efflux protein